MPLTALSTQSAGGTASASGWANVVKANFDVLIAGWTAYTPALTNATLGNGSVSGRYLQMGKTVFFVAGFTLGSTSAVSTRPTITVPLTAQTLTYIVAGQAYDSSANSVYAIVASIPSGGTAARLGGGTGDVTATSPFTWAVSDNFTISGVYEVS